MSSENALKPTPALQHRITLPEQRCTAEDTPTRWIGQNEDLITLTEAARRLPRIDSKKVSVCTLWRWCRNSLRGERLEYVRVGRRVCTSPEALGRFFTRLVELDERVPPDTRSLPPSLKRRPITSRQRQCALAEADERNAQEPEALARELLRMADEAPPWNPDGQAPAEPSDDDEPDPDEANGSADPGVIIR